MKPQITPRTLTQIPTLPRAVSSVTRSQQTAGNEDQRQPNFAEVYLARSMISLASQRLVLNPSIESSPGYMS